MPESPKNKKKDLKSWIFLFLGVLFGIIITFLYLIQQGAISCGSSPNSPDDIDMSTFWQTWEHVEEYYIGAEDLNHEEMVYGAISGMVESLGDPHTAFFNPDTSSIFREDLSGEIEGVGMEIGLRDGAITVIAPLEDTPAQRAGLLPGDQIVTIDGASTSEMGTEEAVRLIRGPKDSNVVLGISRKDIFEDKIFNLTRAVIQIPSVTWEILNDDIAYLKIHHFHEGLARSFQNIAGEILKSSAKGIILDLRNNPGGYLDVAIDIAGWFLPKDNLVAVEESSSGRQKEFKAHGNSKMMHYPIVILMNQGSASGSEILAGALRDNRNVRIIGENSFGKGSVQQVFNLEDNSLIKITIARWLTPNGHSIEGTGLEPDVTIEMDWTKYLVDQEDLQLEKSIEILKDIIE